jgi:hypothetical protein
MSKQGKIDRKRTVHYDKESKRHFYIGNGNGRKRRYYCCEHGKGIYSCKENENCRNNNRVRKGHKVCGCGSGVTVQSCRNPDCDTEGSGYAYCKDTKKLKATCNCGKNGCGGCLCDHGKQKNSCKECNEDYYVRIYRARLQNALKQKGTSQNFIQFLGLNANFFKQHMESSFQEGMNMENYGTVWQIGHRIPIYYKDPSQEEIKERLHYVNAFAQFKSDNASQGSNSIFDKY